MHILVAIDTSRYADAIVEWLKRFPHPVGTRLSLVHVLEPLDLPETVPHKIRERVQWQSQSEGRALLKRAAGGLRKRYPDIEPVLVEGLPIYEVLRLIRERHPDVVVSGTRGLSAAKGLVLGSLSQRLLGYAPCSVMLVPAKAPATARVRVLLATDGSRGAKEAARLLTVLGGVREVTVATVVRPIEGPALAVRAASPEEAAALRAQVKRGRQAVAERALKETADVLRLSAATVTSRIVTGHPVEAIVRLAKKERADLLVVGSRGLRGMMAKAMGSVSLAVAQSAPCAVLVVKPG